MQNKLSVRHENLVDSEFEDLNMSGSRFTNVNLSGARCGRSRL